MRSGGGGLDRSFGGIYTGGIPGEGESLSALKQDLEALLFTLDRPISVSRLCELLPKGTREDVVRATLDALRNEFDATGRAFTLVEVAGGYQLMTRPEHEELIRAYHKSETKRRMSRAALETLAIIAYRQPIKRVDIEAVRGVGSMDIIKGLMEAGLVRTVGREEAPGTPLLYGTTEKFLALFGLKDLTELPRPAELK